MHIIYYVRDFLWITIKLLDIHKTDKIRFILYIYHFMTYFIMIRNYERIYHMVGSNSIKWVGWWEIEKDKLINKTILAEIKMSRSEI